MFSQRAAKDSGRFGCLWASSFWCFEGS